MVKLSDESTLRIVLIEKMDHLKDCYDRFTLTVWSVEDIIFYKVIGECDESIDTILTYIRKNQEIINNRTLNTRMESLSESIQRKYGVVFEYLGFDKGLSKTIVLKDVGNSIDNLIDRYEDIKDKELVIDKSDSLDIMEIELVINNNCRACVLIDIENIHEDNKNLNEICDRYIQMAGNTKDIRKMNYLKDGIE